MGDDMARYKFNGEVWAYRFWPIPFETSYRFDNNWGQYRKPFTGWDRLWLILRRFGLIRFVRVK